MQMKKWEKNILNCNVHHKIFLKWTFNQGYGGEY